MNASGKSAAAFEKFPMPAIRVPMLVSRIGMCAIYTPGLVPSNINQRSNKPATLLDALFCRTHPSMRAIKQIRTE